MSIQDSDALYFMDIKQRVKTPIFIQMERAESGAACLLVILGYYGKFVPIEEIRIACNIDREGSSFDNIIKAAESYGLNAEGHARETGVPDSVSVPAILSWGQDQFVVLEGADDQYIYLNDPSCGSRTLTLKEFKDFFSGVILSFRKGPNFTPLGKPPNILAQLTEKVKEIKATILFTLVVGLCLLIPGLALPAVTQIFIDQIIVNESFHWVWGISFALVMIVLVNLILNYLQNVVLYRAYVKLSVIHSCQTLWHMLRLPYSFYMQRDSAEVAHRLTANDSVYSFVTRQIIPIGLNILLVGCYAITMMFYDVTVALLGIAIIGITLLILHFLYHAKTPYFSLFQVQSEKSTSYSMGVISNIENIKEMGVEYKIFPKWAEYYTKMVNTVLSIGKKDVILGVLPQFITMISILVVLGVGGWRVMTGSLSVGMLVALQILMRNLLKPILKLVSVSEKMQFIEVDLHRLREVNEYRIDPQYSREEDQCDVAEKKLKGYVSMENVCFSYGTLSEDIIRDIHLDLVPGKSVAIVGPTGSGKSTVVKMIAGLYEPKTGAICFDGSPMYEIPNMTLRNSLAVVEQKPFLFYGTARENLTMLDMTIEHQDIVEATKDACIHELILSRQGGYDFIINQDGINLSGGERQCLEIARALVKKPTVLVLDEATSALDMEVEAEVIRNIRRRGVSLLTVAHRINSIKSCDEIIVLDQGKIVAKGTHEELKKIPGIYQDMIENERKQY